jgi:hypothetical protein
VLLWSENDTKTTRATEIPSRILASQARIAFVSQRLMCCYHEASTKVRWMRPPRVRDTYTKSRSIRLIFQQGIKTYEIQAHCLSSSKKSNLPLPYSGRQINPSPTRTLRLQSLTASVTISIAVHQGLLLRANFLLSGHVAHAGILLRHLG